MIKLSRRVNMQKQPKISIIIPVYNTSKYLKKCLDSVINQTYKNYNVIIVNDGSTDNSLDIIKEYMKKSSSIILINQKNMGLSMARNNAVKKVESDFKARNLLYGTKLSTLCQSDRLFSRLGLVKGEFLGLSDNYNLKVNSVKVY